MVAALPVSSTSRAMLWANRWGLRISKPRVRAASSCPWSILRPHATDAHCPPQGQILADNTTKPCAARVLNFGNRLRINALRLARLIVRHSRGGVFLIEETCSKRALQLWAVRGMLDGTQGEMTRRSHAGTA